MQAPVTGYLQLSAYLMHMIATTVYNMQIKSIINFIVKPEYYLLTKTLPVYYPYSQGYKATIFSPVVSS